MSTKFYLIVIFLLLTLNAISQPINHSLSPSGKTIVEIDNKPFNYVLKVCTMNGQTSLHIGKVLISSEFVLPIKQTRLVLNINTKRNVTLNLDEICQLERLDLVITNVDTFKINGNLKTLISVRRSKTGVGVNNKIASVVNINSSNIQKVDLPNVVLNDVSVLKSSISYLNFKGSTISSLFLLKEVDLDSSNFDRAMLPSTISIHSIDQHYIGSLDFSNLRNLRDTKRDKSLSLKRVMRIKETDLDRIKLNYDRFSFHVDSIQDKQYAVWIYQKLLKHLQDEGQLAQYKIYKERYDRITDEINHKPITNWINQFWWDKGNNRTKVVLYCLSLFGLFIIINFCFIKSLPRVYYPDSFKEYFEDKTSKYYVHCKGDINTWKFSSGFMLGWYYFCGVTLYTSFIFWGLKLNLDDLKFGSLWLATYIIIQYLSGLLFVAYIVSFIIVRL